MNQQLSDAEVEAVRALILADNRRQWVVSGIKSIAGYLAIIAGGYLAFKGMVGDFIGWGSK